jgi:hypothetical protein
MRSWRACSHSKRNTCIIQRLSRNKNYQSCYPKKGFIKNLKITQTAISTCAKQYRLIDKSPTHCTWAWENQVTSQLVVKKTVGRTYDIHFRLPVIQKLQIWQENKGYHHNDRGKRRLQEVSKTCLGTLVSRSGSIRTCSSVYCNQNNAHG